MKLMDDVFLIAVCQQRAVMQLALYATHCASGSTLACKSIKADTIRQYLLAVAMLVLRFRDCDPRKHLISDTRLAPEITAVLKEVERWEKIPDRREPYTLEMLDDHRTRAESEPNQLALIHQLRRFFLVGLYGGYRKIKWGAQDPTNSNISRFFRNIFKRCYGFTADDITLRTPYNSPISHKEGLKNPAKVARTRVHHDTQKNGHNGETRTFVRNTQNPKLCCVEGWLDILRTYYTLMGEDCATDQPLAIYKHPVTNRITCITCTDAEREMQLSASRVYNLNPANKKHQELLTHWSCHSLRVGACVILYSMGASPETIQFLLRWRSHAYMDYLRNLAYVSRQQNEMFSNLEVTPNFL